MASSSECSFTDYALERLLDLYHHHDHEVGSQLKLSDPDKYQLYQSTDCITYVLNVISYAFEKKGNAKAAKKVWTLGQHGTELASYLVKEHGWIGIYINPDVNHPIDADSEHTYSYHLLNKTCSYYKIPLQYKVVNYTVTPKTHRQFQALKTHTDVTTLNNIDISNLSKILFGFGLSRGGMHTWAFSSGQVYEVHWGDIGDELYEASSLRAYSYLSGAIVVPPDQITHLTMSAKLKCGS